MRQTFSAVMRSDPPAGMASRALTARLMKTCSIWAGSIRAGHSPAALCTAIVTAGFIIGAINAALRATTWADVDGGRRRRLGAPEHQQLAGEPGGALGSLLDHLQAAGRHRIAARRRP